MMLVFGLLLIIKCSTTTAAETMEYKLELLQALFRHGDRTPEKHTIYPTNPYKDESIYEPYGYGQLTNDGKRREYEIGQLLRKLYGDFLGSVYKPSKVYAYSTDYDRTKMSLQLVLASLYPPNYQLTWNESVYWIPVSTKYNRKELDFLQNAITCPLYWELLKKLNSSSIVMKRLSKYNDTIQYVLRKAGYPSYEYYMTFAVHDVLKCQESMGLPPPDWMTEDRWQDLEEVTGIFFDLMSLTNTMRKIAAGPTLRRFVDNIDDQEKAKSARKIYLYSAHDLNISFFLKAHNFTNPRVPNYGTTVIMEKLRGSDDKIYIRFLVWTGADKELINLKLQDCEEICPFSKYLEIIKPVLPDGSGTECILDNLNTNVMANIVNNG